MIYQQCKITIADDLFDLGSLFHENSDSLISSCIGIVQIDLFCPDESPEWVFINQSVLKIYFHNLVYSTENVNPQDLILINSEKQLALVWTLLILDHLELGAFELA